MDEGYLLTAALPDLQCGIAPLGRPAPAQPRLLGREVGRPATAPGLWHGVRCPGLTGEGAKQGLEELRTQGDGRRKAFSTCGSHLTAVAMFYGALLFMYLRRPTEESVEQGKMVAVF